MKWLPKECRRPRLEETETQKSQVQVDALNEQDQNSDLENESIHTILHGNNSPIIPLNGPSHSDSEVVFQRAGRQQDYRRS